MFLVDRHPQYREDVPFGNPHGVQFDPTSDVLDIRTLMRLIRHHHDPDRCRVVLKRLRGELREASTDSPTAPTDEVFECAKARLENERRHHQSFRLIKNSPMRELLPQGEVEQDDMFIPNASRRVMPEGQGTPVPFDRFIRNSWQSGEQQHLSITGKGGIGKTVALLTFATEQGFLDRRVPAIYIPLHRLAKRENGEVLYTNISDYVHGAFGDDITCRFEALSRNAWKKGPSVILLLDGRNELPPELSVDFALDVKDWALRPGVQIVATSRNDCLPNIETCQLELQELTQECVRDYLRARGVAAPPESDPLWGVLSTPLMLKLYDDVSRFKSLRQTAKWLQFMKDSDSAGHLIWNYLQVELFKCVDEEPIKTKKAGFIAALLLVLPYLCWRMAQENRYEVSQDIFEKYVDEGCKRWSSCEKPPSVRKVDERLLGKAFAKDHQAIDYDAQIQILTDERALLCKKGGIEALGGWEEDDITYVLMHQEFRDALAAMHLCNAAEAAIAAGGMPSEFDEAFGEDTENYLAEIASDELLNELWEMNRLRNQLKLEGPQGIAYGNATHNLLRMARRREDLVDLSFAGMDLRGMCLFGYQDDDHKLMLTRVADKFDHAWINVGCFRGQGHRGPVQSVCFSPDGHLLASGSSDGPPDSPDGSVYLWNVRTGEQVAEISSLGSWIRSVCFSPDGRLLASGFVDGSVRLWDAHDHRQLAVMAGHGGWVSSVCFSPDGRLLASGSSDRSVRLWDTSNYSELAEMRGHEDFIYSVRFSPDGRLLASGSQDRSVRLWDIRSYKQAAELRGNRGSVVSVCFSPDGHLLASGSDDGNVRLWDVRTRKQMAEILDNRYPVRSVCFSPDGHLLASGTFDDSVHLWDTSTHQQLAEMRGHEDLIHSVCFSPDGRLLASGSQDRSVRLWDTRTHQQLLAMMPDHGGETYSVCFSPDGSLLASGSGDGYVRLWNAHTHQMLMVTRDQSWVQSVCFSPDGCLLAWSSGDGSVRLWDVCTRKLVAELRGNRSPVISVCFSPCGHVLASGSADGYVRLWDIRTRKPVAEMYRKGHEQTTVCFSHNGRLLASGSSDGYMHLWDVQHRKPVAEMYRKGGLFPYVRFSPDGFLLASGTFDGSLRLWDVYSCELVKEMCGGSAIDSVCFSPDGHLVASGSRDGSVRLWDVRTGERVAEIGGYTGSVRSVCFSPDGRQVASGSDDGSVSLWDALTGENIESIRPIYGIDLVGLDLSLSVMEDEDRKTLLQNGALVPPPGSAERARRAAEAEAGASAAATSER